MLIVQAFLSGELDRLVASVAERSEAVKAKSNQRAELLSILQTHGALEEYTRLQELHRETVSLLNDIEQRINSLHEYEDRKSSIHIERQKLVQRARRDVRERFQDDHSAITIFNAYSEALYNAPGKLAIDIRENGFDFDVTIERSGSQGIEKMTIFCYDLMLVRLWADTHQE